MTYSIQKLANLANISIRTLHHYDSIGLLQPKRKLKNKYRVYEEKDLLKLQQIMFFRELDFPLSEIKKIIGNPKFDSLKALKDHKNLIEVKKKRLTLLTVTIDKTIKRINKEIIMEDKELYDSFEESGKKYAEEAKERWGNTNAYKQSAQRVNKMSKEEKVQIQKDADLLMKEIAENMPKGPESRDVQKLISKHYNALRKFYEPNLEMYRGLADMYVADSRFTAYYEKYAKGLAEFMKEAMYIYCEENR